MQLMYWKSCRANQLSAGLKRPPPQTYFALVQEETFQDALCFGDQECTYNSHKFL